MKKPKIGDKIYIPSALHVYRGADDIQGGSTTITEVIISDHLPEDNINSIMVRVKGIPSTKYNWKLLMQEQDELRDQYGDQIAHPDPDNRPEFNQPNADWK
jgi:hypothetical protein